MGSLQDGFSSSEMRGDRAMRTLRTVVAHSVTMLVTVVLVLAIVRGPMRAQRVQPPRASVPPSPARPPASGQPPGLPKASAAGPAVESPPYATPDLPAKLVEEADADEQVNIRVYAAVNRSVVNITTGLGGRGLLRRRDLERHRLGVRDRQARGTS